jgi:hypothetical protein
VNELTNTTGSLLFDRNRPTGNRAACEVLRREAVALMATDAGSGKGK